MAKEVETKVSVEEAPFKEKFLEHYSSLLPEKELDLFLKTSLSWPRKSVRVNTLKINVDELKERLEVKGWKLEQVPWASYAFFISHEEEKYAIGNLMEHQLGYLYVQEASSMLPIIALDPKPNAKLLDCCAAPGSKTSQAAQHMNNTGLIVANDADGKRLKALGINLQRLGVRNAFITNYNALFFKRIKNFFDYALVDVPCSGTGTIRKSFKTLEMWNLRMIEKLSRLQYNILSSVFESLKPGGELVYSTCTLEPYENEKVVSDFFDKHENAEPVKLKIKGLEPKHLPYKEFEGITFNKKVSYALRIWPHDFNTDGFFLIKIKKTN